MCGAGEGGGGGTDLFIKNKDYLVGISSRCALMTFDMVSILLT